MKMVTYTRTELLNLTHRNIPEALDELCDRFDYFFMNIGDSYTLPVYDGHTNQSLKMLGELLMKWKEQRIRSVD